MSLFGLGALQSDNLVLDLNTIVLPDIVTVE